MSLTNNDDAKQSWWYARLCLLVGAGVLLILCGAFAILLGILEPQGRGGLGGFWAMAQFGGLMVIDGIGFLVPRMAIKLCSALLLTSGTVYIFCIDSYKRENWWIYCLLILPLLLTLSLMRNGGEPMQEMQKTD